ncbi:hypothetical protein SLEP1_g6198 [Rubroshorea leprosula]|uniref:Uncharacterized protein n=1 Tax=Rubroshorea leprosula TaxID=152421 RepID=A0AAV5I2J0_9ROSI|nr:hypothetical protein SLEP1_g6198 [Rubroshorea leprosula]
MLGSITMLGSSILVYYVQVNNKITVWVFRPLIL